jgi:hypothetical protein
MAGRVDLCSSRGLVLAAGFAATLLFLLLPLVTFCYEFVAEHSSATTPTQLVRGPRPAWRGAARRGELTRTRRRAQHDNSAAAHLSAVFYFVYAGVVWALAARRRALQPFVSRGFLLVSASALAGFVLRLWFYVNANLSVCAACGAVPCRRAGGVRVPMQLRCVRVRWYGAVCDAQRRGATQFSHDCVLGRWLLLLLYPALSLPYFWRGQRAGATVPRTS